MLSYLGINFMIYTCGGLFEDVELPGAGSARIFQWFSFEPVDYKCRSI